MSFWRIQGIFGCSGKTFLGEDSEHRIKKKEDEAVDTPLGRVFQAEMIQRPWGKAELSQKEPSRV